MLIELQDLGRSFGEREVLAGVTANVEKGDRIGIIGANGTGKTTLLRILCGELAPDTGTAAFARGVTCGYLEQTGHLEPGRDIYDTMRQAFSPALAAMQQQESLQKQLAHAAPDQIPAIEEQIARCIAVIDAMDAYNMDTQIRKVLNGMGFPENTWEKKAGVLSGGEQTRLRLARLLLERPDVLILDEPTNHLDIASREWVEAAIEEFEGVLLFVSHDRYFIEKFAERIWLLEDGQIRDFPCGYQKYRSILEHEAAAKPVAVAAPKPKKERPKGGTKDVDKLIRKLEREIEKQEAVIADYDSKIEAAAADYQELTRLLSEKEEAEAVLMELMEQWEAAQE